LASFKGEPPSRDNPFFEEPDRDAIWNMAWRLITDKRIRIPGWLRNAQASRTLKVIPQECVETNPSSGVFIRPSQVTESYLDFLQHQIDLVARGTEWDSVYRARRDRLSQFLKHRTWNIGISLEEKYCMVVITRDEPIELVFFEYLFDVVY